MAHPRLETPPAADEAELLARLRDGDERAFEALVDRHYNTMLAVARGYVKSRAVAEEVVQEAWVGVLKGLDRFEGRSSLRTWIIRIVANIAQTRGAREAPACRSPRSRPRATRRRSTPTASAAATTRFPGTGSSTRRTGRRCPSRRCSAARRSRS